MRFLYNIGIRLYLVGIHIASLFNGKARIWVSGRKDLFSSLKAKLKNSNSDIIWVHCASLGEFEQGRPLMEMIKEMNPSKRILLTFFSPSGYESKKNYDGADHVFYLPIDTPGNVKNFIKIVNPTMAFFIKYEFWFNYLFELKQQKIPVYLVSGIFRDNQHFFKSYGKWFRKQLSCFSHFFLQDENSIKLLQAAGYTNSTLSGDSRFDRVKTINSLAKKLPLIELFKENKRILIAGSTWEKDEQLLSQLQFINAGYKLLIAPHEIGENHLQRVEKIFGSFVTLRYSLATEQTVAKAQVLIIDNIGMLSSTYRYGTIAYIGGGFGKGIHNILEAAACSLPVIFGPNFQKFTEAKEMINEGGAFNIEDKEGLEKTFSMLTSDAMILKMASTISKNYTLKKTGATAIIYNAVFKK